MPPEEAPQAEAAAQAAPAPVIEAAPPTRANFAERMLEKYPETEDEGAPDPASGTGASTDVASTPDPAGAAGEADPDGPAPVGDAEALTKWLKARDDRKDQSWSQRLENQRRSLVGEQEAERRRADHTILLKELDELSDDELAERVRTDRKAVEALALRINAQDATVQHAAAVEVVSKQVPLMLAVGDKLEAAGAPSLRALLEEANGEGYQAMVAAEGGVFAWIADRAMDVGGRQAVEKYKTSAEHTAALEQAKQDGIRDAFGRVGGPPARDQQTRPAPTRSDAAESDNPRKRAAARAAAAVGITDFDPDELDEFAARRPSRSVA